MFSTISLDLPPSHVVSHCPISFLTFPTIIIILYPHSLPSPTIPPNVPYCPLASLIACPIVHHHPPFSLALPKHVWDIPRLEKVNLKSENYQGAPIRHVLEVAVPKKREVETLQIYISHMLYISVYDIHW